MKIETTPEFEESLKRLVRREWLENTFHLSWFNPFEWRRKVRWFIQRGKRGYADNDLWNLNSYLSEMLPKALRQLNKEKLGYPDNPFNPTGMTQKKWGKIMEDMAVGFEAFEKLSYNTLDPRSAEYKKLTRQWKKGSELFIKWYGALWD